MACIVERYNEVKKQLHFAWLSLHSEHQIPLPELMVVSKNQTVERILPLLEAGHRLFGENRVQEASQKWPLLKEQFPDIRLHLIGPLQRNKTEQALNLFTMIETIDRLPLVETICKYLPSLTTLPPTFLLQINSAQESQKSGVWPEDLPALYEYCKKRALPLRGFMCIPPQNEDPTPYFQQMHIWKTDYDLPFLSMGMSNDYPFALPYEPSWIRIGTAIFGSRPFLNSIK